MTRRSFRAASRIIVEHGEKRGELTYRTMAGLGECSMALELQGNRRLLFQAKSAMQGLKKRGNGHCENKRGG